MTVFLVRAGETVKKHGAEHIPEMIIQISAEYSGLPDVRTLSFNDIKFFYKGLEYTLKETTKKDIVNNAGTL